MLKINFKSIPEKTGIYIFKDNKGNVLYIGKAKNLRNRLKQYFLSSSLKIKTLLEEANQVELLETENEALALFKESDLIKKLNPPYNQLLKDNTKYFYLIFTKEKFPKVFVTHKFENFKVKKIIGPFFDGSALKEVLKVIRKEIPYCTCLKNHQKVCLNSSLNLCLNFCCQKNKKFSPQDYQRYKENLKIIEMIFKEDVGQFKKNILLKMKKLINKNDLHEAQRLKKVYLAIKKLESQQNLIKDNDFLLSEDQNRKVLIKLKEILSLEKPPHRIESLDISHFFGKEKVGVIVTFIDGIYQPQFLKRFRIKSVLKPDDPRMIYEVLKRRLKHHEWGYPDLILVDGGKTQLKFALKAINECNLKIKAISLAKPKKQVYFDLTKKPLKTNEIKEFILNLDKKAHQLAINYHRLLRERSFTKNY